MLASDTPQPSLTSSPLRSQGDSTADSNDRIVLLESRLLASSIQLEGQTDENIRLKNVIQLLEKEIDSKKKTDKTQKNEIKKLKALVTQNSTSKSRTRSYENLVDVVVSGIFWSILAWPCLVQGMAVDGCSTAEALPKHCLCTA